MMNPIPDYPETAAIRPPPDDKTAPSADPAGGEAYAA